MGQQARTLPSCNSSRRRCRRSFLLLMASMITLVSRRKVAMLAGGYFFETLLVLLAQFAHPLGRSTLEFGVVFVLPGDDVIQGFELPQPHELAFRGLGQKTAPLPAADDGRRCP